MKITYSKRWNDVLKAPFEPMPPDKARKLHEKRKPYAVVIERDEGWVVIEMCFFHAYCHVLFLDALKRQALRHSFSETKDSRLFLEEAQLYCYSDEGYRPSHGEIFTFKEDGTCIHDTGQTGVRTMIREEAQGVDVSRNYSPIPEFGHYEAIIVRDR